MSPIKAMTAYAPHRLVAPLLIAFLALGVVYLRATPPFETPDEVGHYAYVRHLAQERALPPLVAADNEWEQGQMHQPPLYYALGALLVGKLDTEAWEEAYPRNRYAALGQPHTPGNHNAVLHRPVPTAETIRTGHALQLLRLFSLACSALTVWLAYRLALTILPERGWIAIGTAAVLALTPQFLFIGASVNNDVLVTTLTAAVLLLAVGVARDGGRPYSTPIALGILSGLATLAKLSGLASVALVPLAYLIYRGRAWKTRFWPELMRPLLLFGATVVLVGGWWYLRNALLYGDPLGMTHYAATFAVTERPLSLWQAAIVAAEALPSYWGVFGWMNVVAPNAYYVAMRALTLLAIGGLVVRGVGAWRQRRWPAPATLRAGAVALLWALLMLALILRWSQTILRTQGRLLFPAGGVLALLLTLGLTAWSPRRWRAHAILGLSIMLFVIAAAMPWAVIAPAYAMPARIDATALPEGLPRLGLRYGDQITLLGAEMLSPEAIPGELVWVRIYWRAEMALASNYTQAVLLVGPEGEHLGGLDTLPGMGRAPTLFWRPGVVLVDDVAVRVARDADGPLAAAVRVSLYEDRLDNTLPVSDAAGVALGRSAEIGRVRLARHRPWDEGDPTHPLAVNLGDRVRLLGYDLDAQHAGERADLKLALYWECIAAMSSHYAVFVHLLDANGEIVDQADAPPLDGAFATPYWRPGDRLRDLRRLTVPAEHAGESLTLRVGLYAPATGARLPVQGADPPTDYIDIGPFWLAREGIVLDDQVD